MPEQLLTTDSLSAYLDAEETVEYRLVSDGPVQRELDNSQSTLSPAGEYGSITLVTSGRVQVLVGGGDRGGDDTVIRIPYPEVDAVSASDGFLRSSFAVETTDGETYALSPDEGDVEAAAQAVRTRANKFERVRNLVVKAERSRNELDTDPATAVEDIESSTTESTLARALGTLSDVDVDPPFGVEEIREQIESVWLENYVERAEVLRERGIGAGDESAAIITLEAAVASYGAAADIAARRSFDRAEELEAARDATAAELAEYTRGPVERGHDAVESAQGESGAAAIEAWNRAYEVYGNALDADDVDIQGIEDTEAAVRYQRAWIGSRLVTLLRERADWNVQAAERTTDRDRKRVAYDRARQCLEHAQRIAEAEGIVPEPTDALTAVEDELALLEWEWGGE